jgi:hypothetical protein
MLKKLCVLSILILGFACEEIIEVDDISNDIVVVLAPVDDITINNTAVNFSWEALEAAETYHLQVALPNFNSAEEIVLDTLVSSTNFNQTLLVNEYQWRVKAINSGYETLYTTQNLTIED